MLRLLRTAFTREVLFVVTDLSMRNAEIYPEMP